MKKYILYTMIGLFMCNLSYAQDGMSGYFMHNSLQRSHFNPAFYDDKTFNLSLANASGSLSNSGSNIFAETRVNDEGVTVIDIDAIKREDTESFGYFDVGTLELSIRIDSTWFINAGHRVEGDLYNFASEDLINLAIDGNAPYIGQTLSLNPDLSVNVYNSLYFGLAKKVGRIDLGARVSYLSGIQNVSFESSKLDLTTSPEFYQLQFDNDFVVNSSGGIVYNSLNDIETDFEGASFGKNKGLAFDLGISFNVNESFTVSASAIDIGSITWSEGAQNFTSRGQFEYDGIDISDFINDDVEIELSDSLKNLLEVVETNNEYSTSIASRYLLGAEYVVNNKIRLGGLLSYRDIHNASNVSFALNASARLFKFLDMGLIYSSRPGNPFNLGLHTVWNLGPIQLLFASDNVFGWNISESTRAHMRGGLAIRI